MSISKTYDPSKAEDKWYAYWLKHNFFRSVPDEREPYTIVMPPPNVTGVLHMGHMLNNTIQDVLIRRARMQGKNACWVPGTDHASIATEAKVVAMLKEKGIRKQDLSREEFLSYAWEWKEKYGGIILQQLKKLGASCDWERTRFTMEPDLSDSVVDTFIHLYKKGYIYRGVRMVNWDPAGKTALSDEEVIRKEVQQQLYYLKYPIVDSDAHLIIATTRPETIMADAAICVHPEDPRYTHLHGKKVRIPLIDREIPIIQDPYVEMDFGTGCLKVTPAHDLNDFTLGEKHGLEVIDILNDDGSLNERAEILVGLDRFDARKEIAQLLKAAGSLEKVEAYSSQVGFSERTDAAIEPRLSMQWFCRMEALAKPALDYVLEGEVKLIPDKFLNTYKHWMENVKDWCISRQLWWGHRIPAWYNADREWVVAKTEEEAIAAFKAEGKAYTEIHQDEDVLDTWFSSGLWPISVFDGLKDPDNADIQYYYPTSDLITAPEILFFWVARMLIFGHEFKGQIPFKNVYLTGIVRDHLGRKMSKSLGNSPDPLELMKTYGTDGVRMGMLLSSPAGNDLMFDVAYCEQGRNFTNKIWNAFRLMKGWTVSGQAAQESDQQAITWFENRKLQVIEEMDGYFEQYRLSDALMALYKLVWDDFCSWYLEMIKPAYGAGIAASTLEQTKGFFLDLLKLLHPFMPFISEELWHDPIFGTRADEDCCIVADYPKTGRIDTPCLEVMEGIKSTISEVRAVRNAKQISSKDALPLYFRKGCSVDYLQYKGLLSKLANLSALEEVESVPSGAVSFMNGTDELFVEVAGNIDIEAEKEKIQKDIVYLQGFLRAVNGKLNNARFVENAKPEIVQNERNKKADAEAKLARLTQTLETL